MVIDIVFFGNLVLGQSLESGKKEKLALVSLGARGCYRLPNHTQNYDEIFHKSRGQSVPYSRWNRYDLSIG